MAFPYSASPATAVTLVSFIKRSWFGQGQSQPHIGGQSYTSPSTGQSTSGTSPVSNVPFRYIDARGAESMVFSATIEGKVPVISLPSCVCIMEMPSAKSRVRKCKRRKNHIVFMQHNDLQHNDLPAIDRTILAN